MISFISPKNTMFLASSLNGSLYFLMFFWCFAFVGGIFFGNVIAATQEVVAQEVLDKLKCPTQPPAEEEFAEAWGIIFVDQFGGSFWHQQVT